MYNLSCEKLEGRGGDLIYKREGEILRFDFL
jgi:hypothetical protein